jgi:hypothetical protein
MGACSASSETNSLGHVGNFQFFGTIRSAQKRVNSDAEFQLRRGAAWRNIRAQQSEIL